jgi:hypothetical protein
MAPAGSENNSQGMRLATVTPAMVTGSRVNDAASNGKAVRNIPSPVDEMATCHHRLRSPAANGRRRVVLIAPVSPRRDEQRSELMTTPKNAPKNVIVVLLDSLNRHMLGSYGGEEFDTPNLDRLAARSARFERHVTGALPCMPARHDLLVGAHDFLWRPWGSIELWEDPITVDLATAGVTTMLVSDHPHLFESGGEN